MWKYFTGKNIRVNFAMSLWYDSKNVAKTFWCILTRYQSFSLYCKSNKWFIYEIQHEIYITFFWVLAKCYDKKWWTQIVVLRQGMKWLIIQSDKCWQSNLLYVNQLNEVTHKWYNPIIKKRHKEPFREPFNIPEIIKIDAEVFLL